METYKLRYNLFNYLIDNDINFTLTLGSKNVAKYFILAIYIFFILIIISDTTKISYIIILFIIFGILFIYFTFILDNKITKIIENKDFIDYCILFRLFNCIFIDSYNSNKIPIYIKYDLYPSISKTTLSEIKEDIVSDYTVATIGDAANAVTAANIAKYYKEIVAASSADNEPNSVANPRINNGILFDTPYLKDNEKTEIIRILNVPLIDEVSNENFELKKIDNKYYCLIFKVGTIFLTLNTTIIADILVVGGGGAGGNYGGGGGGGGKVIYNNNININLGSYEILIGIGADYVSLHGSSSIFKNRISNNIIYTAGGGGTGGTGSNGNIGRGGGGGGGAHSINNVYSGGNPNTNESGKGGNGGQLSGGGGGGGYNELDVEKIYLRNGLDVEPIDVGNGGNGGNGLNSDISGDSIGYGGGGGGGGSYNNNGGLGMDGGGNGGGNVYSIYKNGTNGYSNTGGGGGGSGCCSPIDDSISEGIPGLGGSGVVIIKILNSNNIIFTIPPTSSNNTPTSAASPIIIGKRLETIIIRKIINRTFIIVFIDDRETDINIKNIYEFLDDNYQIFSNYITKVNQSNNYFYVIDFVTLEENKNKSIIIKNIYDNLKTYFIEKHNFSQRIASVDNPNNDKLTTLITNATSDNNYLKTFYSTLLEINTNIKYDDNIGKDNIYSYSEELINNKSILKFINIYNNDKYKILKKYIFIKINNSNTYIKDSYSTNKILKINPSKIDSENISAVIIDISSIYSPGSTTDYFLVDIETINKYVKEDRRHINEYILKIYDYLLENYNNRLDLNNSIENFDILFKEIVPDKKIQEPINDYLYIYNIIIIVFIILMIIVLHIIYIELFRFL